MRMLFTPVTNRQLKRQPAKLLGYYTTKEAAKKLGVDVATLRYRRDTADAKRYWTDRGVMLSDAAFDHLAQSHKIIKSHHYFEQTHFDKFVRLYLKRPEVQRARKAKLAFPKTTNATTYTITTDEEIAKIARAMHALLASDGALRVTLTTP